MKKPFAAILLAALMVPALAGRRPDDAPRFLDRITSREDFDRLARILEGPRFADLPHVMFVIDRRARGRVYYVNSNLFRFHKDFVNAAYLSLERGRAFYDSNYVSPDRRFLLGTIAFQPLANRFTFEFWEGDRLTRELLAETRAALAATFYTDLAFKPNSAAQAEAAAALNAGAAEKLAVLTPADLHADLEFQPLNLAAGIGQLRILDHVDADTVIDRNQIVIFKETPVQLAPLSGIITTSPASPLSHANLLARAWGIPNAYIRDADTRYRHLEGKYVRLEVTADAYRLTLAEPREVMERQRRWLAHKALVTPPADLAYRRLTDLGDQRAGDARRFGAKSANLGEVFAARLPGVTVPAGFTIPFAFYQGFIRRNGLEERIAAAVEEDRFVHDPAYRKRRLAEIREWIEKGEHDPAFARMVTRKARREYAGKGLFVRSSTNAEDLKDFSGAGLYTTVPNVRTAAQLLEAIKKVWASIWNYEAYEARDSFGMNHFGVYPAVLVQEGVDADSAGVAITADPFDPANRDAVYVNAKRGLGIRVVEGRRVPEQVIYQPGDDSVRVLTRSDEDTQLQFDAAGGVREVRIEEERAVLSDEMVRRLARAALGIERLFGSDQDIEWLFYRGRLFIVQARPFVQ